MRYVRGLVAGLAAAGLAGCGAASGSAPASQVPVVRATASSVPSASPHVKAAARVAAAQFDSLYSASRFAAFWDLLSPAIKRQIPRKVWVKVHDGCRPARAARPVTIKAVTVFGSAAIITEAVAGASSGTAEDVFSYVNGRWRYSPQDLIVYHHGSVARDIAAAKAAGFCASWKIF